MPDLERATVLVIEDDPDIQELIVAILSRDDRLTIIGPATSAEEGLALAVGHVVNVIVLDDRLAGPMPGRRIVPALRAAVPHARIIFFSASSADGEVDADVEVDKLEALRLLPTVRTLLEFS